MAAGDAHLSELGLGRSLPLPPLPPPFVGLGHAMHVVIPSQGPVPNLKSAGRLHDFDDTSAELGRDLGGALGLGTALRLTLDDAAVELGRLRQVRLQHRVCARKSQRSQSEHLSQKDAGTARAWDGHKTKLRIREAQAQEDRKGMWCRGLGTDRSLGRSGRAAWQP